MNESAVPNSATGNSKDPTRELKVGGCLLDWERELYLLRPIDEELPRLLASSEPCHVFAPGQTGKTSLLRRTVSILQRQGIRTVMVDCADLEAETEASVWFHHLLMYLSAGLELDFSITDWWEESPADAPHQKLMHFLRTEVAEKFDEPIVLFLDGMDSLLSASFLDDLISIFRTIYNDRPFVAAYRKLTFCLAGTVLDSDLFSGESSSGTGYDFGTYLELPDFDPDLHDLQPLLRILDHDSETALAALRRILYWTQGHPYLTMKFVRDLGAGMSSSGIVSYIDRVYPSPEKVEDEHFLRLKALIDERVRGRLEILEAYRDVLEGNSVAATGYGHFVLEMVGLIRREDVTFALRSRLHGKLFDSHWLTTVSPERRIGPYRIEGELGDGHSVFRAFDERLDRQVAIKHLSPQVISDANYRQRLRQEVQIVSRIKHSAALRIHDILETDQGEWIVMELVEGRSLREILATEGPLGCRHVAQIAEQVAAVLAEAHSSGLLHRDLRAENVMISTSGTVKLLNLGLVKQLWYYNQDEVSFSVEGNLLGTGRAMSPEQILGQETDHRSDLFALGTLLYLLTTGKRPFAGSSLVMTLAEICNEQQVPAAQVDPEIPSEFSDLIEELLAKDPKGRPSDTAEVCLRLRRIAEQLPELSTDLASRVGDGWKDRKSVRTPGSAQSSRGLSRRQKKIEEVRSRKLRLNRRRAAVRRIVPAAAILIFLLTASWLAFDKPWQDANTPGIGGFGTEKVDLAVLGFRNLTQKDEMEWMKSALIDLFAADLGMIRLHSALPPTVSDGASGEETGANLGEVSVVSGEKVRMYLATHELPQEVFGEETLFQVGRDLGADFLLTGAYVSLGAEANPKLRLTVRLQDTQTGITVATLHETGRQDELFEIVTRATVIVNEKLVEYLKDRTQTSE